MLYIHKYMQTAQQAQKLDPIPFQQTTKIRTNDKENHEGWGKKYENVVIKGLQQAKLRAKRFTTNLSLRIYFRKKKCLQ